MNKPEKSKIKRTQKKNDRRKKKKRRNQTKINKKKEDKSPVQVDDERDSDQDTIIL